MAKYMVTGWCSKWSSWNEEMVTAKNKQSAMELFKMLNPTLRSVKVYRLKGVI